MAKESMKAREVKRAKLVARYAAVSYTHLRNAPGRTAWWRQSNCSKPAGIKGNRGAQSLSLIHILSVSRVHS